MMGVGQRLRLLRLARGYSLEALASAMGNIVSKQAISQYEKGRILPSPIVLQHLARALGVHPNDLLIEQVYQIEVIAFRCRKRMAVREQQRIGQIACWELEKRLRIEQLLGNFYTLPLNRFRVLNEEGAEEAAGELRHQWGLGNAPIANMVDTLETHGVHVICLDASADFDGLAAIARDNSGVPVGVAALIRKGVPGERQRLSLAHELGHLVLRISESLDEERIAYRFAGAFLVPAETLRQEVGQRRSNISLDELLLLKQRYGVSLQSLLYRLRELGIISETYYVEWMRWLTRKGWRRCEPQALPEETPQRFRQMLLRAVAQQLLTLEDAQCMLGEPLGMVSPLSRSPRRALLQLPIEERRRILQAQAEQAAADYPHRDEEYYTWQGGDFFEYPSEPETR
jgi:Zn-dependent peptidase ImmA (M78 family)/DNA-binding XRE family transcriptional regulator